MSNGVGPSKAIRSLNESSSGEQQDGGPSLTNSITHDANSLYKMNSAPSNIECVEVLESTEMTLSRERGEDSNDEDPTEEEDEDDAEKDEDYREENQERDGAGNKSEIGFATFCRPGQIHPLPAINPPSVDEQNRTENLFRPHMPSMNMPPNYNISSFQAIKTAQQNQISSSRHRMRQLVQQTPTKLVDIYSQASADAARCQAAEPHVYSADACFHAPKPGTIPVMLPSQPYERTMHTRKRKINQTGDPKKETRAVSLSSSVSDLKNGGEAAATYSAPRPQGATSNPLVAADFQYQENQPQKVRNHVPNLEFHQIRATEPNFWSFQHIENHSTHWENRFSGSRRHSPDSSPTYWPPQRSGEIQPGLPMLSEVHENSQPIVVHPGSISQIQALLMIQGDLSEVKKNWTENETKIGRRLVRFERRQSGIMIKLYFTPISQKEYHRDMCAISCIWRKDTQEYLVTSVDCILLLELIICQKFSTEEKNRIRRNLEVCKPTTISKRDPALEYFFKKIMSFPPPRPRNIEKDIKVFLWDNLAGALSKIVSRYSAPYV